MRTPVRPFLLVPIAALSLVFSTAVPGANAQSIAHHHAGFATTALKVKPKPLPSGAKSRVQHVVVVMVENRSFDHLLG